MKALETVISTALTFVIYTRVILEKAGLDWSDLIALVAIIGILITIKAAYASEKESRENMIALPEEEESEFEKEYREFMKRKEERKRKSKEFDEY